jgi:quinol monooxygenase YgiN
VAAHQYANTLPPSKIHGVAKYLHRRVAAMSELFIVVALYAKDGREQTLRRDLFAVVEPSRKENGNLRYELFVDRNDARRFVFVERWVDQHAQQKHHTESEHIRHFHEHGAANVERTEISFQLERIA